MVSFSFPGAVLDLVALASTVTIMVMLIFRFQPLYEKWQASQRPEGRALLLWSAFLIYITWVATAALYCRNLDSLWNFMGICLEKQTVNRPLYALLHLYLFLLLACGGYGLAITVFEIFQNRKMLRDLFTIARFGIMHYQHIEDLEAHADSSSTYPVNVEDETSSAVDKVHNSSPLPLDEDSRSIDHESRKIVAPVGASTNEPENLMEEEDDWPGSDVPSGVIVTRGIYGSNRHVDTKSLTLIVKANPNAARFPRQQHPLTLDSDGDKIIMTPSSPSTSDDSSDSSDTDDPDYVTENDDRHGPRSVRPREALENRRRKHTNPQCSTERVEEDGDDDDSDNDQHGLYYASPRLNPQDHNAKKDIETLDISREPPSPCDSCSSAHASSIPIAKRSPVRVPTTPTSPTADANDADTEKTDVDVEQKQRVERRLRNLIKSAAQGPHADGSRCSRAHAPDQSGNRITPTIPHSSTSKSSPKPRPSSPSSPTPCSSCSSCSKTLSPQQSDPEAGLYLQARDADERLRAATSAPHAEYVSLALAFEEWEDHTRPAGEPERKGKGSGKGGKEGGLVIEIPSLGMGE